MYQCVAVVLLDDCFGGCCVTYDGFGMRLFTPCMILGLECAALFGTDELVNGVHLFFASDKNAASAL